MDTSTSTSASIKGKINEKWIQWSNIDHLLYMNLLTIVRTFHLLNAAAAAAAVVASIVMHIIMICL